MLQNKLIRYGRGCEAYKRNLRKIQAQPWKSDKRIIYKAHSAALQDKTCKRMKEKKKVDPFSRFE